MAFIYPRSSGRKGLGRHMLTNINQVCKKTVPSTFYYELSAAGQQCRTSYSTLVCLLLTSTLLPADQTLGCEKRKEDRMQDIALCPLHANISNVPTTVTPGWVWNHFHRKFSEWTELASACPQVQFLYLFIRYLSRMADSRELSPKENN